MTCDTNDKLLLLGITDNAPDCYSVQTRNCNNPACASSKVSSSCHAEYLFLNMNFEMETSEEKKQMFYRQFIGVKQIICNTLVEYFPQWYDIIRPVWRLEKRHSPGHSVREMAQSKASCQKAAGKLFCYLLTADMSVQFAKVRIKQPNSVLLVLPKLAAKVTRAY